jgi:hypothetical protein
MLSARTTAQVARGRIAVVQEQRFRLTTEDGRSLLLTLAHDAAVGAGALCRLRDARTPVEVEYTGEPNLETAVAHAVRSL